MRIIRRLLASDFCRKENLCFFTLNFFIFSVNALYFGFLVKILNDNGYTGLQASIISSLSCIVSLMIQPVAGYITDTFLPMKSYLILSCIGSLLTVFLFPLWIGTIWGVGVAVFLFSLFFVPVSFLVDSWLVALRDSMPHIDYGRNRLGGSAGYALISLLAGRLVTYFASYNVLFISVVICIVVLMAMIILLPSVPCRNKSRKAEVEGAVLDAPEETEKSLSFIETLKILFTNKIYITFLISAMIYYIALRPSGMNIAYKVMELNGNDTHLGIALFFGAVFECPILFIITKFTQRYPLSFLYIASTVFILIRDLLLAFAPNLPVLMVSQMMQAFSYSTFLVSSIEIVNRTVPQKIRSTGITLMVGVTNGIGGVLGMIGSGVMIDRMGVTQMAYVLSVFAVASTLLFAVPVWLEYRKDRNSIV